MPRARLDSSSRYYLIDADADIRDLCNAWASKGYAGSVFEGAGWRGHKSERWYLEQLYAAVGIQGSSAAQQLLGKAKSLKSVGGSSSSYASTCSMNRSRWQRYPKR